MNRYVVNDVNKGLFEDDTIIFAKNSADAVMQYMKQNSITGSIQRSVHDGKYGKFKVTKTKIVNEKIYKIGKDVWYLHIR